MKIGLCKPYFHELALHSHPFLQNLHVVANYLNDLRLGPHDATALPHVNSPQLPQTLRVHPGLLRESSGGRLPRKWGHKY